jgi:predicted transport protein
MSANTGRKVEMKKSARADYFLRWDKRLQWVDKNVQSLALALSATIENGQNNVVGKPRGKYYCFYKGNPSTKSIFATLCLFKNYVKVRIRADPKTFRDTKKWTGEKVYKKWFFLKGQEREFKITGKEQITYAMELIKQSYELAK